MAQTSPILRFALEILHHALENYSSGTPRHRKVAILNLAQAIELVVKATLVENNVSIYDKGGRTLNPHEAMACLAKLWNAERVDGQARIELLLDERNEIQHRYGNVDEVSLDYHMETTFIALRAILEKEFDTDLDDWIRDNVDQSIWSKIRFLSQEQAPVAEPSDAVMADRSATLAFIDGFSRFESRVRSIMAPYLEQEQRFTGSTLDFAIKALSNALEPPQDLLRGLPGVYRLRNRAIHGDQEPTDTEVSNSLSILDRVLSALKGVPEEILGLAVRASMRGVRGTRLPTRAEEAQNDFKDAQPESLASGEGPA
jgi:hypothetical protein